MLRDEQQHQLACLLEQLDQAAEEGDEHRVDELNAEIAFLTEPEFIDFA